MGPELKANVHWENVETLEDNMPYDSNKPAVLLVRSVGFFHVLSMSHILF